MASVETDRGVKEQLRLYDTKGLHDGQDLPKHYYSVADGFVLVYSIDNLESFRRVDVVKKEIDKSRDKKEACLQYIKSVPLYKNSVRFVVLESAATEAFQLQWQPSTGTTADLQASFCTLRSQS